MPKLTESEIKAALSALEKKPGEDPKLRKALRSRRREGENVLTSYLRKTGFDFDAYEKIRAQSQTEMRRLLKEAEAAAVERSSSGKEDLSYAVESWRKSIEHVRDGTVVSQFVPGYVVLDTPFIIWPTTDLELDDSHIQPWNNTAKIRALWRETSEEDKHENLRFIFVWENPNDRWVIINVESNLTLNGSCDAFAEGGILLGSVNSLWVQAVLNVLEWWNQPPTKPYPQATQTQKVLAIVTNGDGFLSGGTVESKSVSGPFDLRRNSFLLPPHGVAVFEVTLEFYYNNSDGGMIQVNFASGDFEVKCPAVVIAVLS